MLSLKFFLLLDSEQQSYDRKWEQEEARAGHVTKVWDWPSTVNSVVVSAFNS